MFSTPHHVDTEDVFRSVAVHRLSHPAEVGRHVAQPVDGLISVVMDDGQDLIVLLCENIQHLGGLVQLHMQVPDAGALWRQKEEQAWGLM